MPLILVAALGDLAVFALFVFAGRAEHSIIQEAAFWRTALPFRRRLVRVVAVARSVPNLNPDRARRRRPGASRSSGCLCGVIAVVLRVWLTDRTFQLTFALVAIGVQAVMLFGWRVALSLVSRRLFGIT